MSDSACANIPLPSPLIFRNGIAHPDLWLWDSWVLRDAGDIHLYCLAVARTATDGEPILPSDRNDHTFHVRRFVSSDGAASWQDRGSAVSAARLADGSDGRNIWSGSVTALSDGRYLFMHTGVRRTSSEQPFVQSLNATIARDPAQQFGSANDALICAERDYDKITEAGYHLGPRGELGNAWGEKSGPILAVRDPFTWQDKDGEIHVFFSAKTGPATPAIGHALLDVSGNEVTLNSLLPPLNLPDAEIYTQAEVPKIYQDEKRGLYYMLISACDRLYEGQPDAEVKKEHRLYKSTALGGPWAPYHENGSLLPGLDGLFGASLIAADFDTGDFSFVAPYTEMVGTPQQLTFAPVRLINIYADPDPAETHEAAAG